MPTQSITISVYTNEIKNIFDQLCEKNRAILEIFEESVDRHLSADEVYKKLVEAGDEVGLATVYRVLTQFESAGILLKQNFENGHSVYELTPNDHHDHMVCLKTGKVIEFTNEIIEEQQEKLAAESGYKIVDHKLVLYVEPILNND